MIYLSIDLDFWSQELPFDWFEQIAKLPISKIIVVSHEQLLPHINKHCSQFDTLVNVDFHSDLCSHDPSCPHFECDEGTWANFVNGSKEKEFIWSPPNGNSLHHDTGFCHGETYINPFRTKNPNISGWKRARIKTRFIPDLSECVAIGFAISPYWTNPDLLSQFAFWYKDHQPQFEILRGVKTSFQAAMRNN